MSDARCGQITAALVSLDGEGTEALTGEALEEGRDSPG